MPGYLRRSSDPVRRVDGSVQRLDGERRGRLASSSTMSPSTSVFVPGSHDRDRRATRAWSRTACREVRRDSPCSRSAGGAGTASSVGHAIQALLTTSRLAVRCRAPGTHSDPAGDWRTHCSCAGRSPGQLPLRRRADGGPAPRRRARRCLSRRSRTAFVAIIEWYFDFDHADGRPVDDAVRGDAASRPSTASPRPSSSPRRPGSSDVVVNRTTPTSRAERRLMMAEVSVVTGLGPRPRRPLRSGIAAARFSRSAAVRISHQSLPQPACADRSVQRWSWLRPPFDAGGGGGTADIDTTSSASTAAGAGSTGRRRWTGPRPPLNGGGAGILEGVVGEARRRQLLR